MTFYFSLQVNSEGSRCERCKAGSFYKAESHDKGCLDCVCMGITTKCTSSTYYLKTFNIDIVNKNDPTKSILFLAADGSAVTTDVNITVQDGLPMAGIPIGANANTNWEAASELMGNLLGLYGSNITITVFYTATDITLTPSVPSLKIYGAGNSVLEFPAVSVPINVMTKVSWKISEKYASGVNVTRQDVLKVLVDVTKTQIPAAWYPMPHQSL